MNYTQNYHLGLPIPAERYDVSIVNANNTVIDGQLKTNADAISSHANNVNNPHGVTAAQVGLGNVNNTADSVKPVSTPQSQYIASAVAAEATRATNAEGALSDRITTAAGEVSAEVTRATGVESTLSTQITNEVTRAQGAESDLRDYVDEKLSVTYKASGSVFFADLPALAASREGHVYNIKDDFTTTADFVEGAGKDYPAGTNVVIIEKDEESYETATVEEGDNPSEMGLYELDGTDYIPTEDTSPVSGKTYYELVAVPTYYYDVLAGFVDTSDFITDTDYATAQAAGIVKPDGTTITVDANGVIRSQGGGGDVSSEEMADVVNILGAKNLVPPKTGEMQVEIDNMTVTFREDGSAYISGQEGSGQPTYTYTYNKLPKGRYTISINNEDAEGVWLYAEVNGYVVAHSDTDSSFTLDSEQDVWFGIGFDEQNWCDGERIWPTCIPYNIEDKNFVAFAKTNKQLTVDVNNINPRLDSILNFLGSKNLLPPKPGLEPEQVDHADVTFNSDGSITIDGSCGQSEETLISSTVLPKGKYELVVDQEEQQSGVGINIYDGNHNLIANADWLDDFTLANDTEVFFYLKLYRGFQEQDYTIFPMVQPADVKQYDNAPYAKTNRQLTETVLKQTLTAGSTSLTFTDDRITDDCLIKIAPKRWVPPTSASQSGNTVTVTFPEQAADLDVAVLIREL
ncbi:hypothetical protein [Butyrivibrio sp. INlla21]|uniref:hypothetical protein n=1 Tax=Butyrivibrio sp. INlla21 TaxID=1520811 RepID=UPI0008E535A9|nr:hypothetical protein [Butyrivibrio sp. INlla21]SFU35958.1 hypothetical protein SAMN02910342_00232 [Butyrivibrio sp. INlla21]